MKLYKEEIQFIIISVLGISFILTGTAICWFLKPFIGGMLAYLIFWVAFAMPIMIAVFPLRLYLEYRKLKKSSVCVGDKTQ